MARHNPDLFALAVQLEDKRKHLMLAGDLKGLNDLLSEDLSYVHSSGSQDDKDIYLSAIRERILVYHSLENKIEWVHGIGEDGFVVGGKLDLKATVGGNDRQAKTRFMLVWRREQGTWRLLSYQGTVLTVQGH